MSEHTAEKDGPEMVLLTEKCAERNCGTRVRYGELTDAANTHWHVKRGVSLVLATRVTSPVTTHSDPTSPDTFDWPDELRQTLAAEDDARAEERRTSWWV